MDALTGKIHHLSQGASTATTVNAIITAFIGLMGGTAVASPYTPPQTAAEILGATILATLATLCASGISTISSDKTKQHKNDIPESSRKAWHESGAILMTAFAFACGTAPGFYVYSELTKHHETKTSKSTTTATTNTFNVKSSGDSECIIVVKKDTAPVNLSGPCEVSHAPR